MTPLEAGMMTGMLWASILMVWTLTQMTTGEYSRLLMMVCQVYYGFEPSLRGVVIGGIWAFGDGFLSGYVFFWLFFS